MHALVLAVSLAAASPVQQGFEPGSAATPGRWTNAGGCAARTGRSLSAPIRTEPEVAWQLRVPGAIESEPLVWDDTVVLAVQAGAGRRAIHVLELETGRTLTRQVLPAGEELAPAVWGDRIAVRPEADRVDVYVRRGNRLLPERTIRGEESVSEPLFFEDELYLRVDGELARFDRGRREPVWTTSVDGAFRGSPSLRGDGVFALWYGEDGPARLALLRRADGRVLSEAEAGHHDGRVPGATADAGLSVHGANVFLHYPLPVPSSKGTAMDYGRIELGTRGFSRAPGALYSLLADPIPWRDGWIAPSTGEQGPRWLASRVVEEGVSLTVLADSENHPDLLAPPVSSTAASLAGDVVYIGPLAADLGSYEILWRRRAVPLLRPVPAERMLLVVERPDLLVALREGLARRSPAAIEVEHVVERLDDELAEGYAALAHRSLRLGDAELSARLVAEAARRGARGRTIETALDGLVRLRARSRPARVDPRRRRAIEDEEAALLEGPSAALMERARNTGNAELQRALLRALLERAPDHREGIELARELVPRDAPVTQRFAAASWLDFLDVHARTPVRFLELDAAGTSGAAKTPELRTLEREIQRWRRDLSGYRSDRLYVVSPPGRPGAVARCLEVGELVCDVVEEIFSTAPRANGVEPMTLLLYDTQEEYVAQSRSLGSGPEIALGWTAGHYSLPENLSRMFVPEDDEGLRRLLGVYAHELTHHWLATRAPFDRQRSDPDLRGFWIAEGFPSMVEEFRLDPRARTWQVENPRAESLDAVANAHPDQLLPWDSFFSLTYRDFAELSPHPHAQLPLTWRLGVRAEKSPLQMFYAQAGAVCHYLFRSSPQARARLVDYVRAWYEGDRAALDARTAFGIEPGELGARTVAFARAAVQPE